MGEIVPGDVHISPTVGRHRSSVVRLYGNMPPVARRTVASADCCSAVDHGHQASCRHYRLHQLHILAVAAALYVDHVFISASFEVVVIHHRRCCFLVRPLPSRHQSVIWLRIDLSFISAAALRYIENTSVL